MYLEEYRNYFSFFDEESSEVLKTINFQPVLRFSYQQYLADGRKYVREILREYPKYREHLKEEMTKEYYASEYADRTWQKDCEIFGEECRKLIEDCNREFLAMPKIERRKKLTRIEDLFFRYEEDWKYLFSDFKILKEDYLYLLPWKE